VAPGISRERRAVLEACEAALLGDGDGEVPGPFVDVVEAVAGLAGVEYQHGIGPLDAAAETLAGDQKIGNWATRVESAHRSWLEALAGEGTPEERQALEDQRLGFEQLAAREPYHAWISFNAAVRAWKGNAAAVRGPMDEEEEIPTGCLRCFGNPDILSGLSAEAHRRTDELLDDSHLGVFLAECVHCGQPSLQVFEEEVDWTGGDDAQRYEIIAITEREREMLRSARPEEAAGLAKSIGSRRVRMWWDWPTGGTKTAGRVVLRHCRRCGKDVLAFRQRENTPGRLRTLLIHLLGGFTQEPWRCRICGSETEPPGTARSD
jgi:hypothetical protein